ncbi:hypothetical protein IFM89_017302 [Coptis chinensis]|uniref:DNA topoisomerase (ATP-hydrolyzing) n=1 Tax=Coptis chinensis TaxID=261450 RepID=A0A835LHJ5_9MAGN|nr:hypothetical protein IFM89_017302 [Coptis chinensis]
MKQLTLTPSLGEWPTVDAQYVWGVIQRKKAKAYGNKLLIRNHLEHSDVIDENTIKFSMVLDELCDPRPLFTTSVEFDHTTVAGPNQELAFSESQDSALSSYPGRIKRLFDAQLWVLVGNSIQSNKRCSDAYSDTVLGYASSIRTVDGGTHIDGVKASLTKTLNYLGKKSKLIKAALAAKRARELVRQESVLKSSSLFGKLADCSATDPAESGMLCFLYSTRS